MFINFKKSRSEALSDIEASIARYERMLTSENAQARGAFLNSRLTERLAEAQEKRDAILALSEEEWARKQAEAQARDARIVAYGRATIDEMWDATKGQA